MTAKRNAKGQFPREYDRATLVPAICARLAAGEPLSLILRDVDVPRRTVDQWRQDDAEIAAQFAAARDDGYDAIAADCLDIADTGNAEDVQRAKLRVDTRLKLLAKWDPRRYGDALKLSGDPENPITGLTDAQVDARLAVLLAKREASAE